MRRLISLAAALLIALVACSDDDDGKEACEAFAAKCAGGAPVACDPAKINASKDPDAVEDCIEDAVDCNAAQACLQL